MFSMTEVVARLPYRIYTIDRAIARPRHPMYALPSGQRRPIAQEATTQQGIGALKEINDGAATAVLAREVGA